MSKEICSSNKECSTTAPTPTVSIRCKFPTNSHNGFGATISGFLSGKYTREDPKPAGSRRVKFDFPPVDVDKGYVLIDRLREFGSKYGASIPQIALAWVLARPVVSTVLIGASNAGQLKDNLAAESVVLSAKDIQFLDDLTEPYVPYPAMMLPMGWDAKIKEALGR